MMNRQGSPRQDLGPSYFQPQQQVYGGYPAAPSPFESINQLYNPGYVMNGYASPNSEYYPGYNGTYLGSNNFNYNNLGVPSQPMSNNPWNRTMNGFVNPQVNAGPINGPINPQINAGPMNGPVNPQINAGPMNGPVNPQVNTGPMNGPVNPQINAGPMNGPVNPQINAGPTNGAPTYYAGSGGYNGGSTYTSGPQSCMSMSGERITILPLAGTKPEGMIMPFVGIIYICLDSFHSTENVTRKNRQIRTLCYTCTSFQYTIGQNKLFQCRPQP
jgi:hypothetical protein